MNLFSSVKIVLVFSILVLMVGCTSPSAVYSQTSPVIQTVKQSAYTTNIHPAAGSVPYAPYTVLESSVKQAAPTEVTVTYDYRPPSRSRAPRGSNCVLYIKSALSSLSDVMDCDIENAGNTFIVTFETDSGAKKAFDLHALGGKYIGGAPLYYSGSFISISLSTGQKRSMRYVYRGPDPFGL